MKHPRAFTLIELLIVVAIIAILAAIAVPNFLEAQVRSKVSRVKADMRSMATALESYKVDNNKYPPCWTAVFVKAANWVYMPDNIYGMWFAQWALIPLTTPVAYMTSIPGTSFNTVGSAHDATMTRYDGKNHGPEWSTSDYTDAGAFPGIGFQTAANGYNTSVKWRLRDVGPDLWANNQTQSKMHYFMCLYDSTNGTVSSGDIIRWGP